MRLGFLLLTLACASGCVSLPARAPGGAAGLVASAATAEDSTAGVVAVRIEEFAKEAKMQIADSVTLAVKTEVSPMIAAIATHDESQNSHNTTNQVWPWLITGCVMVCLLVALGGLIAYFQYSKWSVSREEKKQKRQHREDETGKRAACSGGLGPESELPKRPPVERTGSDHE